MNAANREEDVHLSNATVLLEEDSHLLSPNYGLETSRVQKYAEKLRQGGSFLNLILVNVATGINQHRLRQMRCKNKSSTDLINLYNETEKIGALEKPAIARLEKLFRTVLRQEEFWTQKASWILTRLEQWNLEGRMPVECSIPGMLSIEVDPALGEEEAWQEAMVVSACGFYTAGEWLGSLDLSGFSAEEIEKLLGIRPSAPSGQRHALPAPWPESEQPTL